MTPEKLAAHLRTRAGTGYSASTRYIVIDEAHLVGDARVQGEIWTVTFAGVPASW